MAKLVLTTRLKKAFQLMPLPALIFMLKRAVCIKILISQGFAARTPTRF
jgi:hypothetical protein